MRIRSRPQPALQLGSDPTTSTAPQQSRGWLEAAAGEDREARPLHAAADIGRRSEVVARRLALPQVRRLLLPAAPARSHARGVLICLMGMPCTCTCRFGAASNGYHSLDQEDSVACVGAKSSEQPMAAKAEEPVTTTSNGALQLTVPTTPAVAVKEEEKASSNGNGGGGAKKRRGPAVLLEGSRCSRVNGRGWRCSQPTLVGYLLCEHHLGKGRMRSAAAAAAAARGRLGRTEHVARIPTVAVAAAVAPPSPKAEAPASLPPC
ncbi:hypothetical protein HU200_057464 [Digitaria exilis]|uniref:WRC domain-containing protein n=1 Tax=Digitaria exilis TaxID=1010633 RepID=A0A835AL08_9POAL|nr:hypothetical protein HU200_057464 [Digitaria exilis]